MVLEFDEDGRIIVPKGISSEKDKYGDRIFIVIRGVEFCFDNETAKLFKDKFNFKGQAYINRENYLCRKNDLNKIESFHKWLMKEEILSFCEENNLDEKEVEIHHKNENKKDNSKDNLECKRKPKHREDHNREWAWEEYRKKNSHLWREKGEEYYKKT